VKKGGKTSGKGTKSDTGRVNSGGYREKEKQKPQEGEKKEGKGSYGGKKPAPFPEK